MPPLTLPRCGSRITLVLALSVLAHGCSRGLPARRLPEAQPQAPVRSLEQLRADAAAHPGDPLPLEGLARGLIQAGQAGEALGLIRGCLREHPRSAQCWNDLGMAQVTLGDVIGARASWRKAVALDGSLVSPRFNLAQLFLKAGDTDAALGLLEAVVAKAPRDPAGWDGLGQAALQAGRLLRARQAFETASRLQPAAAGPWLGLAEAELMGGDLEASAAAARRAERLDGREPKARLFQALVTAEGGTGSLGPEEAEKTLQADLRVGELRGDAAYGLGLLARGRRRAADAVVYLRLAVESNPAHMQARYHLARALLAAGRREEGERRLRDYRRLFQITSRVVTLRLRLENDPDAPDLRRRLRESRALQQALFAKK